MSNLGIYILGVVSGLIFKMLWLVFNQAVIEWRKKRFLRMVRVKFPDNSSVYFTAIGTSDKQTMRRLTQQLRDELADDDTTVSYRMDC